MWRLFMRILLSLLQYAACVEVGIMECQHDAVCTLFVKDKCKWNGVMREAKYAGHIWEDESSCEIHHYNHHYARLDFKPITVKYWQFILTYFDRRENDPVKEQYKDGSIDNQHLYNIGFDFGNANIAFPGGTKAQFSWRETDKSEWRTSDHNLNCGDETWTFRSGRDGPFHFSSCLFNVTSDQHLLSLLGGPQFTFKKMADIHKGGGEPGVTLDDPRFFQLLNKLSPCDPDELTRSCYGGCDEMEISNGNVSCPTRLWFHDTSASFFTRSWQSANRIQCGYSYWNATWKGGQRLLDSTLEVQCSAERPTRPTPLLIALIVCGTVLLIILLICCVCGVMRCMYLSSRKAQATPSSFGPTPTPKRPPPSSDTSTQREDQYQPLTAPNKPPPMSTASNQPQEDQYQPLNI